jgi:hypothetical protein
MGGDQTPLLRRRLVPALLLVVPSTAALSASAGIVHAVEECRLEPGWQAPAGSKWVRRINRDHRRCWFLSSKVTGGHHTQPRRSAPVSSRHFAGGKREAMEQDQRRERDLKPGSPSISKTDVAVAAEPPSVPQSTTPSVEQSSANLIPHSVPTIAYKVLPTTTQTDSAPTVDPARVAERAPAGASNTNLVLLAGAAAAALLFAGGTFHFTRPTRRRARTSVGAASAVRGPALIKSPVAAKRPTLTTDRAHDLKRSLVELKRDLKNASDARDSRPLPRKGVSSGAVSLPPAAAWLTRPKAKPPAEQTVREFADA